MSDRDRRKRHSLIDAFAVYSLGLLVVILVFFLGEWVGKEAGRDEVTAREHYQNTKQNELLRCSKLVGSEKSECEREAIEAAHEQSNSRQDLYAQRTMARWTLVMGLAAIATFSVTALGVFYIRDTLRQTVAANKAARDAVEVTRDIGQRQIRAYVSNVQAALQFPTDDAVEIVLTIENKGQTPAYGVRLIYGFEFDEADWVDPAETDKDVFGIGEMPPGGIVTKELLISDTEYPQSGITDEVLREISRGEKTVIVFGKIWYKDAFGSPRETEMRMRTIKSGNRLTLAYCDKGNYST